MTQLLARLGVDDSRNQRARLAAFIAILIAYVILIIGVIHPSPLLTLDRKVLELNIRQHHPDLFPSVHTIVEFGQRGPATVCALPWFVWRTWKSRSSRPFVMLLTALLGLNASVGVVKIITGRLGPLRGIPDVHAIFRHGSVLPSGHTSNAVVLYGVIAMLVVEHRRIMAGVAVFLSLLVGACTVYLDTHWLTDVIAGWMAGGLVLLALPTVMPWSEWVVAAVARRFRRSDDRPRATGPRDAPRPVQPVAHAAGTDAPDSAVASPSGDTVGSG